jgi:sigma-B regulation protein RsbU (phosphoserine phosphatase)
MPAEPETPPPGRREDYESHFDHAALFEFSRVINESADPGFVHNHILLTIMGKILSPRGFVAVEREPGTMVVESVKGFGAGMVGRAYAVGEPPGTLILLDEMDPAAYPWVGAFRDDHVHMLLPMMLGNRMIGLLGFAHSPANRRLAGREQTYLRSLANISATAVAKIRTIRELQLVNRRLDRKLQELRTLFELGKEFGTLLDPDRLVRLLVFSLMGQVGVHRYLVALRDGQDVAVAAARLDGPQPQRELLRPLLSLRRPARLEELEGKQYEDARRLLGEAGLRMVVPMQLQDQNRGFILVGEKMSREAYTEEDDEFLGSLAALAIVSIENARLFKEAIEKQRLEDELAIARDIQKGLLPNVLPRLEGIDLAAANISSKQVGGDYYDVIPVGESRHVIAIGDVSGKGYPAALLMANLQATIRALVPTGLDLPALTARVNDLICDNTGSDKFITFFWGFVDTAARTLTYVNAGHNPPYLVRADGSHVRLDRGGMILGVLKTVVPYDSGTVSFSPGDVIVLFTDGVSEAMNREGNEYGEQRLEGVIRRCISCCAQEMTDAIHRDIVEYAGGAPQSDDITMMILRVTA